MAGCRPEPIELEWNQADGYRWANLQIDERGKTGFEKLTSSQTGIRFNNFINADDIAENHHYVNGSGVAAGDINGNGWIDLYFTRLNGPNKLYMNLGGMQFKDITEEAGVAHNDYYSRGAVFADINGDGHLDLLVTSVNRENSLYMNDGTGNFTKVENSGLGPAKGSTTMALADINGNGYLDLYVARFKEKAAVDIFDPAALNINNTVTRTADGFEMIPPFDEHYALFVFEEFGPARFELGERDELYLNNGDGTFDRVEDLENHFLDEEGKPRGLFPDWGLDAKFQDLNGNGLQDLYVANDVWTPDRVWMNQGDGTFRAMPKEAIRRYSYSSMSVDFSDINRNGLTDIFVVEMLDPDHQERLSSSSINSADVTFYFSDLAQIPEGDAEKFFRHNRNSLYLNRGDDTFSEIAYHSGLEASGWSWSTRFMDINLNGYEDILITNGFTFNVLELDASGSPFSRNTRKDEYGVPRFMEQQNKIFRNNGDLTFEDVSTEWGFTDTDISHGLAVADLNNNGTLDVVVNRLNEEAVVYNNTSPSSRIAVRLKGNQPNTQAAGAKVKLKGGPVRIQSKEISVGGDYLSGSDLLTVFAADESNLNHELIITWQDGMQSRIDSVQANKIYEIDEYEILKYEPDSVKKEAGNTYFRDVSHLLDHQHHEDPFDDFKIQPLLPIKLSQLGPGVALIDLNQNNFDDIIIGSGKGGSISIFENRGDGQLFNSNSHDFSEQKSGDQTAILGWKEDDLTHLIVGSSHYERGITRGTLAFHYQIKDGNIIATDSLPSTLSTTGPLAAADYTGNGRVDLFVGGRFVPGNYPRDVSSMLFTNEGGRLIPDENNSILMEDLGLVTSALFVDYNQNGLQDLIVATEWGPVRLFENQGGNFVERTDEYGLNEYTGWWQGLAAGDFTGNGYPDLAVTNWGENTYYQDTSADKPLKLFYNDFNQNGRIDIIDSYFDKAMDGYVPRRHLSKYQSIHHVLNNTESNRRFAGSTVEQLLNLESEQLPTKKINTLTHMVFLNDEGNGFNSAPLPVKTQFAPGFYVGVADMDNDGNEDIFMTQNFFTVPEKSIKPDAGRSKWLKGDGNGNFEVVPGHISGVKIYGDQRGAALGDINNNGKVDLIVSQNSSKTRLFFNKTERSGYSVRLTGPDNNKDGIGSTIRLIYEGGKKGPARFIKTASGYWSQNSMTQIMGYSDIPEFIKVEWFDGTTQYIEIEDDVKNYNISYPSM